jgi:hypothetical protein
MLTIINGDADGDGLPDAWETLYGLNPNDPRDTVLDTDGDGMTNLQEYRAGTSPVDKRSVFSLNIDAVGPLRLQFVAQSNRFYAIQFATNSVAPAWQLFSNFPPSAQMRTVTVNGVSSPTNRMRVFRVVTP